MAKSHHSIRPNSLIPNNDGNPYSSTFTIQRISLGVNITYPLIDEFHHFHLSVNKLRYLSLHRSFILIDNILILKTRKVKHYFILCYNKHFG